jgi:hypothetical protein
MTSGIELDLPAQHADTVRVGQTVRPGHAAAATPPGTLV